LTDNTRINENEHNTNYQSISSSTKIDVAFVQLMAFDKKGHRVGYGKGFYDKFLAKCKPEIIKIGLSFFEPEELISDVLESDVMLDYCVTPSGVYEF
jgi:5-formyltetrahydrofolate cyclo-ligase